MTPDAFEFTVKMPADARLLEAIKLLAMQAAGYARLPADAGAALAADAERETQAAIRHTNGSNQPLELLFAGTDNAVTITISREGHTRLVRQATSA